jgi:hypothetical protein
METLPHTWIDTLRWTPNLERWELGIEARIAGWHRDDAQLRVRLFTRDALLAEDVYRVISGEGEPRDRILGPRNRRLPQ